MIHYLADNHYFYHIQKAKDTLINRGVFKNLRPVMVDSLYATYPLIGEWFNDVYSNDRHIQRIWMFDDLEKVFEEFNEVSTSADIMMAMDRIRTLVERIVTQSINIELTDNPEGAAVSVESFIRTVQTDYDRAFSDTQKMAQTFVEQLLSSYECTIYFNSGRISKLSVVTGIERKAMLRAFNERVNMQREGQGAHQYHYNMMLVEELLFVKETKKAVSNNGGIW